MKYSFSRRHFLTATGCLPLVSPLGAAEAQKREDKSALPVIPKNVEKVFMAPGQHPNDLDAVADGLWILDQADPNKAHKVRWEDGKVLVEVQTESMHGSGIAYRNGALWISSTATGPCPTCLKTLKVDAKTGKTLAMYDSPGAVESRMGRPGRPFGQAPRPGGSHGIKFVDDYYWQASPPAITIYKVQPDTGKVVYSIPAPGARPHGLAWENGYLWCVESNDRAVYKMDPETGELLAKIQLTKEDPEPHGLAIRNGVLWYCDAASRWVCRLV
jgi:outer membrane protein assembly factor BamB